MAYKTTTEHEKGYPYTSIMAAPYSCDSTGATSIYSGISQLLSDISNAGTIFIPKGTFKLSTNLTIPIGVSLKFAKGGQISVDAGVTLTISGYIEAGPWQIFTGAGTISIATVNELQFGDWTGGSGTVIQSLTLAGGLTLTTLTLSTSLTVTPMSTAGFVKNSVAGLLSGGNSIVVGDLPTAIPAANIANGTVSNADFQFLAGVDSNIQDQLDALAAPSVLPYAILQDQKASGTAGGTFTSGSWQTRTLNTEVIDTDGIVTLAANQFTLAAGTYRITARAPAYGNTMAHKAALYNVTDASYTAYGTNGSSGSSYNDTSSVVTIEFTIADTKTFELRHRSATTIATNGFGAACTFGVIEIYSQVEIWKIA